MKVSHIAVIALTVITGTLLYQNLTLSESNDALTLHINNEQQTAIKHKLETKQNHQTEQVTSSTTISEPKINPQPYSQDISHVAEQEKQIALQKEFKDAVDHFELAQKDKEQRPRDNEFEGEEIDQNWAYEYETQIRSWLANENEHNFDLHNVTCKSSRCKVTLYTTEDNATYLAAMFTDAISKQDWRDSNANVTFSPTVIDGTIEIDVDRYEATFP